MNAAVQKSGCPADETLAAFIDGRLDPEVRSAVVDHLADCAECRDAVNTAWELAADAPPAVVPIGGRRSWILPAASVLAAAAIGWAIFLGPFGDRLMAPRRLEALTSATSGLETRPIAARPSLDADYRPYRATRGESGGTSGAAALYEATANIAEAAEDRPTPTNLHHLGLAHLLVGHGDEAIAALERALTEKTKQADVGVAIAAGADAGLLNDLAAAYYARRDARRNDETRAAAAANRAWQLDKSAPVAWTRATILDTRTAWDDYLAVDSTSAWAAEAREHREQAGD